MRNVYLWAAIGVGAIAVGYGIYRYSQRPSLDSGERGPDGEHRLPEEGIRSLPPSDGTTSGNITSVLNTAIDRAGRAYETYTTTAGRIRVEGMRTGSGGNTDAMSAAREAKLRASQNN